MSLLDLRGHGVRAHLDERREGTGLLTGVGVGDISILIE
jgi:hypothetical protein